MPTVSYRHCPTHGEALHGRNGCAHCHPCEPATPKPVVLVRRAKPKKRQGNLGRPASTVLTDREKSVVSLRARGLFEHEIATALGITRNSVQSSTQRALARMGAQSIEELYRYLPKVAV